MIKYFNKRKGTIFITVIIMTAVISLTSLGIISLSRYHLRKQYQRMSLMDAFYTAENAMLEGIQKIADEHYDPTLVLGTYVMKGEENPLQLPYELPSEVKSCAMKIERDPMGVEDNFVVTATAKVNDKTRSVKSLVRWRAPSTVFDYEYFLNNWGWWWGGTITGHGDQRSNWDFDFRNDPHVYGHIFAAGDIESNQIPVNPFEDDPPFLGAAGNDPITYCHVGTSKVDMPNLMDLDYYVTQCDGSLFQNGATVINGVHGDDEAKTGIYLEGTAEKPLEINGEVLVYGDCIIKGKITGQGVLYVGGNLYIAGNLEYANGPDFSAPPTDMEDSMRDDWVDNSMSNDLVGYAVRGTILAGQVNSSDWVNSCYSSTPYGLQHVGDESTLGADGIKNTPDDGVNYLDTDDDGVADSSWYDADQDGVIDSNYDYENEIKMSETRISNISNYPVDELGAIVDYNTAASSALTLLEGIFYTNHAFASKSTTGPQYLHGSMICRDEAWIYTDTLKFYYDPRIHSRYQRKYFSGDPNRIIDLGLPIAENIHILDRYEIPPTTIQ